MFESFFLYGAIPDHAIKGVYDPLLIFASYIVAVVGSYAGLVLSIQTFRASSRRSRNVLRSAGALALGGGIWSMHFIGMLAYKMRMVVQYDLGLTVLSLLIAVATAYSAMSLTQAEKLPGRRILLSSVVLGVGICAMHYTGMAAMQMRGDLRYLPSVFFLSVVVAILASAAALWILFTLGRHQGHRTLVWGLFASLLMGAAVCGMHYTGMAAAVFTPWANCRFDSNQSFDLLAVGVISCSTILMVIITFVFSNRLFMTIGSGALLALPLLIIVLQSASVLGSDIHSAENEYHGVEYHSKLTNLLLRLQDLRGVTYIVQKGDVSLDDHLLPAKSEVYQAIRAVDGVDRAYGEHLDSDAGWSNIKHTITSLVDAPNSLSPEDEFNLYTADIHSLNDFSVDVADNADLTTDLVLSSYYLQDISVRVLPEIMESLGQMRGFTTGLLASGQEPQQWTGDERQKLQAMHGILKNQLNDLASDLSRAKRGDEDAASLLDYQRQAIEPAMASFQAYWDPIVSGSAQGVLSLEAFNQATAAITAYDGLYHRVTDRLLNVLTERQNAYQLKRDLLLYSSTVALLGLASLLIFLYFTLEKMGRVERAATQAKEVAEESRASLAERLVEKERLERQMQGYTDRLELSRVEIMDANQKLKEKGDRIRAIVDNVMEGIITIDEKGVVQTFNVAAEHEFGYSADEMMGANIRMLVPPPDGERHDSYLQHYMETGEKKIIGSGREVFGLRKDGSRFPLVLSISEVVVGGKKLFIGLLRDISQQREKE